MNKFYPYNKLTTMNLIKSVILISVFILSGCATKLYMPTQDVAFQHNTTLVSLQKGRTLYGENCGNCHKLHKPSKYNRTEWVGILDKMQKPAKIDDYQKDLILKYLQTAYNK